MTKIQFVKPNGELLKKVAENMSPLDVNEVLASGGFTPLMALTFSVLHSEESLVILVDGEPVAVFGLASLSSNNQVGLPWLLTTPGLLKIRKYFLKHSWDWMQLYLEKYPTLTVATDARHYQSHQWLLWLGFDIVEVIPHFGFGQLPFYRLEKCAIQ